MPRIQAALAVAAVLTPLVTAGIEFTQPKAGATLEAGESLEAAWSEGGDGPDIADLTTFILDLVAGSNDAPQQIVQITPSGSFATGNKAQGMVGVAASGDDAPKNAYFLRLTAVGATGGQYVVYSDRFSYSGMTGTTPDAVLKAKFSGTDGPKAVDSTSGDDTVSAAEGDYAVEYTMQTGATRYAPMQPVPGTKITAKTASPQYPTSAIVFAKSHLPIPSIETTVTQSQTHKVSSMKNTNAAAARPSDDMAKFLNRWKD